MLCPSKFKPLRAVISRTSKSIRPIPRCISRPLEMVDSITFGSASITGPLVLLCQVAYIGFGSGPMVNMTSLSANRSLVADTQPQVAASRRGLRAGQRQQKAPSLCPTALNFQLAGNDDFAYIYRLCESTMRSYVETDLGDCFERIARPTIQKLLQRGKFSRIYADGVLVGAVAHELHETHIQIEEIYLESERQNQGLGTKIMRHFLDQSGVLELPIRLHVLSSNPARRFYERLGFSVTRTTPEVNYMEYVPPSLSACLRSRG